MFVALNFRNVGAPSCGALVRGLLHALLPQGLPRASQVDAPTADAGQVAAVAQASLPAESTIAGTEACATMRFARSTVGLTGGFAR